MPKDNLRLPNLVENLSHELRTPLNAILGYSELLDKSDNLDTSDKNFLNKITNSGGQLLNIINDIIEVSSIESGNIKLEKNIVLMDDLMSELNKKYLNMAKVKGIDLQIISSPEVGGQFQGDEKKIKTIIYSLVNNAIKFTKSGSVSIQLSLQGNITNTPKDYEFKMSVSDTGIGIAEKELDRIFTPFYRVNPSQYMGTGLGLTTCQRLISFLGGSLEIKSKPGEGTQVAFTIPVEKSEADPKPKIINDTYLAKVNTVGTRKALVVDDLPINRNLARIMLERQNFEIIEAENGAEALEYYHDHKPDVVLMDISMPVMNGIEAMETIRKKSEKGNQIPIIAITAGGHTGSRFEMINRGFSEYIQKPFKEKELFDKISLFLPIKDSKMYKNSSISSSPRSIRSHIFQRNRS